MMETLALSHAGLAVNQCKFPKINGGSEIHNIIHPCECVCRSIQARADFAQHLFHNRKDKCLPQVNMGQPLISIHNSLLQPHQIYDFQISSCTIIIKITFHDTCSREDLKRIDKKFQACLTIQRDITKYLLHNFLFSFGGLTSKLNPCKND